MQRQRQIAVLDAAAAGETGELRIGELAELCDHVVLGVAVRGERRRRPRDVRGAGKVRADRLGRCEK